MKTQKELSEGLKKEALNLGFNVAGIANIPGSNNIKLRTDALQRWLKSGNQADMKWMESPKRQNVNNLLKGAKSILAVGLNYYVNEPIKSKDFFVARYAWGNDYHKVLEKRLKILGRWLKEKRPDCNWKICIDSSPFLDKAWAEEAGIGWIGKNSNLINKTYGSWLVLGHLICTENLIPDRPSIPLCGRCKECINLCPTNAITEPFVVDSRLCIAYHNIENRNLALPSQIKNSLGSWIAGCDICQDICPWNHKKLTSSKDPDVQPRKWILELTSNQVLKWTDEMWRENLKKSALKRIKPWMWRRNAKAIQESNAVINHESK